MDKGTLQLVNLGLSIFNKLQTIQHRQIRMNNDLARTQQIQRRTIRRNATAEDAEILTSTEAQASASGQASTNQQPTNPDSII